jgi:CHAT domain-containing protein
MPMRSGIGDLLASGEAGTAQSTSGPRAGTAPRAAAQPEGLEPSPAATALPAADPQPDRRLARDVAVLIATRSDSEHFTLLGHSVVRDLEPEPSEQRRRPSLSLADIRAGASSPVQILDRMYAWSEGAETLVAWLAALRARLGDDLKLVIQDATGFEIPWELLTLPGDQEGETVYLGAAVAVTRCPLRTLDSEHVREGVYAEDAQTCSGAVAAYVSDELELFGEETRQLEQVGARRFDTMVAFQEFLDRSQEDCAMVYLACHGIPKPGLDAALGSQTDAAERIVLGTLNRRGVPLIRRCRSAVVLNACHSGRFTPDEHLQDDRVYGFPSVFVGAGAFGVIGTAGEVPDADATAMAKRLLDAATAAPAGTPLSAVLRDQRYAIADAHARHELEDARLVAAFLYIFFGSPRATVAIG